MRSPVNWAVLGLVIEKPSYGFEIATRFRRVYADVLRLSGDGHVYQALNALERRELIEMLSGTEFGRQPKPIYEATPAGRQSYEDYLVSQVVERSRGTELWVRQLSSFIHDRDGALRVISRYEREYQRKAGSGGASMRRSFDDPSQLIDALVFEQQRIDEGGMLAWLGVVRAVFEARAGKAPDEPSPA